MYSIWKYSLNLAGYDQQDAHEFLMSCLDGIHSHCEGTRVTSHTSSADLIDTYRLVKWLSMYNSSAIQWVNALRSDLQTLQQQVDHVRAILRRVIRLPQAQKAK